MTPLPALLLLHFISFSNALPADWFLDAVDTWSDGRDHPWFWSAKERRDHGWPSSAGQQYERIPKSQDSLKELIPQIFQLRHAYVALKAVPWAHKARKAVLKAHRRAMGGKFGMDDVLDTNKHVRRALKAAEGRSVPVDTDNVPIFKKKKFEGHSRWAAGLGLAGPCDVEGRGTTGHECDEEVEDWYGEDGEKVETTIRHGVRHLDSAYLYGTDRIAGKAWRHSGVDRKEFFITTKLRPANEDGLHEEPTDWVNAQLDWLDTDFVDALLLHHDDRDSRKERWKTWKKVEEIQRLGRANHLGLSSAPDYRDWQKCVDAGVCKFQSLIIQQEPLMCSKFSQMLHTGGLLKTLEEDKVELVFHTATMCRGEPIVAALAKKLDASYYSVTMAWMQGVGSSALFTTLNPKHVREDLRPPLVLTEEEKAGLWGISLIYGLAWCDEPWGCDTRSGGWCQRNDYFNDIVFDPLGIKELFRDTDAPCIGARPDWDKEAYEDDDDDDDDDDDED